MGGLRNTPPLIDIVLAPFARILGPYIIYKYYPSIAYGLLCALASLIAIRVYNKNWIIGFLTGLAITAFILNLRISWDYQRQLLGSIMMLATLLYLETKRAINNWGETTIIIVFLASCGLSHEVTGLVGFTLSLASLYKGARERNLYLCVTGVFGLVINTLLETWYWGRPYSYVPSVGYLPIGLVENHEAHQVIGYLITGYGLTLPLALITLSRYKRYYVTTVVVTLLLAGASPLIAPYSCATT